MAGKDGFAKAAEEIGPFLAAKDGFAKTGLMQGRFHGSERRFCENGKGYSFAKPSFDAIQLGFGLDTFRKTVIGCQKSPIISP